MNFCLPWFKGKNGKSGGEKKFGGVGRETFNTFLLVGLGVVRV
jgi:hypothetical protein